MNAEQPGAGQNRTHAARRRGLAAAGDSTLRLTSLDAFRGLVILTMIFVNFLSGVDHIPSWAKHMPDKLDGYTLVDLVFPGFLFIVGVAIPLAVQNRWQRGDSLARLLGHIVVRAAGLLFLGVILVNKETFSAEATGMSEDLWFLLALASATVLWTAHSGGLLSTRPRWLFSLRLLALLVLGYALVIFRGNAENGRAVWLQHSWWGILGLIGWAYLNCSLVYLAVRGSSTALIGVMGFMIALYIGGRHGRLDWLGPINNLVGVGEVLGSTSANVMAGVVVGNLFVESSPAHSASRRIKFMLAFGLGLYLAGTLLRPLHGIIKNQATESYTLVAAGICCLLFALFYWVIDVGDFRAWAGFLLPAGQNPLLAYLLPDLVTWFFAVIGLKHFLWPYSTGGSGALNAALLTAVILLINRGLAEAGVRLKL
jgi:heparan-alpha-glucosaminide N-acetyltransferase